MDFIFNLLQKQLITDDFMTRPTLCKLCAKKKLYERNFPPSLYILVKNKKQTKKKYKGDRISPLKIEKLVNGENEK